MACARCPRILLADPDGSLKETLGPAFSAAHYEAVPASDAHSALAALAADPMPDAVLAADALPDGPGLSLCAAIRENLATSGLPFVLILDRADAHAARQALHGGADACIARPLLPDDVVAHLAPLLRSKARQIRLAADIERVAQIGIALSSEHDLDRLLELIVDEARAINHADAGTLYTVDPDRCVLDAQVVQNGTLGKRDLARGAELLRPVPLDVAHVSGYVALTGQIIQTDDVYEAHDFDFSGTRVYDQRMGYRSQSMLVVPMVNHDDEVIGVLQLINALDPQSGQPIPFHPNNVARTHALASEAAIALTKARLIQELRSFVEGLIQAMAVAVDEKSHYTAGHIQRVTRLAVALASAVNECPDDRFAGTQLSADEVEELRIAGLLHDIGKIVVPEHVVDKATKLQCVYDRMAEVCARFSAIRRGMENESLRRKLALAQQGAPSAALEEVEAELQDAVSRLEDDLAFLSGVNSGGEFMAPERLARLHSIASHTYLDDTGAVCPYLTANEVENLAIPRGTLLPEEFAIIRGHAAVSARLLRQIPFARKLRNVPVYAGEHHEALNGSGYPGHKSGDELSLQSRILTIADIYDALTSSDRPYKKAYTPEVAFRILREEAARGKLDARLVEIFISSACSERVASS